MGGFFVEQQTRTGRWEKCSLRHETRVDANAGLAVFSAEWPDLKFRVATECTCHQATGDSPDCPTHGSHAKCRMCFDEGIRYGHIVCDCAEGRKRRAPGVAYLSDRRGGR